DADIDKTLQNVASTLPDAAPTLHDNTAPTLHNHATPTLHNNAAPTLNNNTAPTLNNNTEATLQNTVPYVSTAPPPELTWSSNARFQIMRPHARGGLGQVYLARDIEL